MESSDWKVTAVLNRDALEEDIAALVGILKRQRVYVVVSASADAEARDEALKHLEKTWGISSRYVQALHPRRMPT